MRALRRDSRLHRDDAANLWDHWHVLSSRKLEAVSMRTPYPCRLQVDLTALLDRLPADALGHSAHGHMKCEQCGDSFEFRLFKGRFEIGFSYWAGSLHFEATDEAHIPGLVVTPGEPDDLEVTLGERHWEFRRRFKGEQIFMVFEQAWSKGRTLAELGFDRLDVEVMGVERDHVLDRNFSNGTRLAAGERLLLRGYPLALQRAWNVMLNGPDPE